MSIRLEDDGVCVSIDPEAGGRLEAFEIQGLQLLVERSSDPLAWGCYPMAPWAGRVRRGRFQHAGRHFDLPLAMPPHAIHGTTFDRAWREEGGGRLSIDLGDDWPFPGIAVQEISLAPERLTLRLEVHATDVPFPASLGWHPWFARRLGRGGSLELAFSARAMYPRDEEGIPTEPCVPPPPGPWDDCFRGLDHAPQLTWPGALRVEVESALEDWVVYDEPEHALCVEPLSHAPDALNRAPDVVEPGRPLVAEMAIRWTLL